MDMKAKNKVALDKIVAKAFINANEIEFASPEETFRDPELVRIAKGQNSLEDIAKHGN